MRTHGRPPAVEQAESRCLPSTLAPGAQLHAVSDRPPDLGGQGGRARGGHPDWFTGDPDALDRDAPDQRRHEREFADDRPVRSDDGDERLIGRPALPATLPMGEAPDRAPVPTPDPESGRAAGTVRPVVPPPVAPAPVLGPVRIVSDRVTGARGAADVPGALASAGKDRPARAVSADGADAAPAGCPAEAPEEPNTAGDLVRAVAIAVEPIAGLVPFGRSELQEEVGRFLSTVVDLDVARTDALPAWGESLWVGAALLLAGGAAHAAAARSSPPRPADPRCQFCARQLVPNQW